MSASGETESVPGHLARPGKHTGSIPRIPYR